MAGKAAKAATDGRTAEHGGFFAVHRDMWHLVSQQATMNEAVSYLVLARGSHFGTRRTSWSVDSVERYTAIARSRAKEALAGLVKAKLILQTRMGTKPQYFLPTEPEFERLYAPGNELSDAAQAVLAKVRASKGPITLADDETFIAEGLEARGLVISTEDGNFFVDPDIDHIPRSAWIWLPNSIVDGVDGRPGPADQIRQTQDKLALRLFVDLYYWQSLASNGGLHWRQIRQEYEKAKIGQRGIHDVWGFRQTERVFWGAAQFVQPHLTGEYEDVEGPDGAQEADTGMRALSLAIAKLHDLGVIQFVPHLIDADTEEGEVIHPCPILVGVPEERAITAAAQAAALRLMTDGQERYAYSKGYEPILPLPRHLENAVLVGLLRTTHRAHTAATAKWISSAEDWARWVADYNRIGADA